MTMIDKKKHLSGGSYKVEALHTTRTTTTHSHNFFELVYVTDGSAIHTVEGTPAEISKGDYFIIEYGCSHAYSNCRDFGVINCLFVPEFIDATLKGCKSYSQLITNYLIGFDYTILSAIPANKIFRDSDGTIYKLFSRLLEEYRSLNAGYVELSRCHLIEILVLSMRGIYMPKKRQKHPAIGKILKYTEENYQDNISLRAICDELGFSLPYISKKFKEDTGVTFTAHLQRLRTEQALRLLAYTDKTVTQIARIVGYGDIKFFGEVFKKEMNMTPREWRRLMKKDG